MSVLVRSFSDPNKPTESESAPKIQRSLSDSEEWKELCDIPGPSERSDLYREGLRWHNKDKNRYGNIIPLDETRIVLEEYGPTNYINANKIDVGGGENFIACQAPLLDTFNDFWWMVWFYKVTVIGMFTDFIEKGKVKAYCYWPKKVGYEAEFGTLRVKCIEQKTEDHFDITKLEILHNEETRTVYHYHYREWPDFGVPEDANEIRRFFVDLPNLREDLNSNVVIHCSAGCGRAGVMCAIYRKLKTNEPIQNIVESIRMCRQGMVQSKSQYKFIYTASQKLLQDIN